MRRVLLGLALLAPATLTAQVPYRGQSGYDTGPVVPCTSLDGSGSARCLMPGQVIYDSNGIPLGTAGNPLVTSGGGTPTGTAGNPNAAVVTVQGIANGTVVPISSAQEATIAANQTNGTQKAQNYCLAATSIPAGSAAGTSIPAFCTSSGILGAASGFNYNMSDADVTQTMGTIGVLGGVGPLGVRPGVWNGASWDKYPGDTVGAHVTFYPSAAAGAGIAPITQQGATANVLKAAAGNVYSVNVVNSTVAGFLVIYNATAAPASGTAISAANGLYCMPVAASVGFRDTFQTPIYASVGATLLMTTSCTTYTPIGTAPITLTGQAK